MRDSNPQASEAVNAAEAEPTTLGSGDQHGQRTPALAVAVSRVRKSRRRPTTTNDASSVTIVVTPARKAEGPTNRPPRLRYQVRERAPTLVPSDPWVTTGDVANGPTPHTHVSMVVGSEGPFDDRVPVFTWLRTGPRS